MVLCPQIKAAFYIKIAAELVDRLRELEVRLCAFVRVCVRARACVCVCVYA